MHLRGFVQFAALNDPFHRAFYHLIVCFVVHLYCPSICRPIRRVDGLDHRLLKSGY